MMFRFLIPFYRQVLLTRVVVEEDDASIQGEVESIGFPRHSSQ
jgi:hypothetical protein